MRERCSNVMRAHEHEFLMTESDIEEWRVPTVSRPIALWNTERFQSVRWGPDGSCIFDNSRGLLP